MSNDEAEAYGRAEEGAVGEMFAVERERRRIAKFVRREMGVALSLDDIRNLADLIEADDFD